MGRKKGEHSPSDAITSGRSSRQIVIRFFAVFGILLFVILVGMLTVLLNWDQVEQRLSPVTPTPLLVGGQTGEADHPIDAAELPTPVSSPTPTPSPTAAAWVYYVRSGESLAEIAARYNVPLETLQQLNNISDPDSIQAEQQLLIPFDTGSRAAPSEAGSLPPTQPSPRTNGESPLPPDNPLTGYTIPELAARTYDGGSILKEEIVYYNAAYTQWSISYLSEGITVTSLLNIPTDGAGPWPVIIILHGGFDQSVYVQGTGTSQHADFFARNGYLVLMPDYRSYNNTEGHGSPLKIPWAVDVLELIAALDTLPEADPTRIGVLGQSRGGGIATYIMVISQEVKAVSLYASLSTDQAVVWRTYLEEFEAEWPVWDAQQYGSPDTNPEGYRAVSPATYLEWVSMPIQIHHGAWDNVTPVRWSRDLNQQLLALGKNVEYIEYPEGGHGFTGEDYTSFLQANLRFFDTFVKE